MTQVSNKLSPKWSNTTKLVVMLTFVAIALLLFLKFQYIIGPLLISFILSYLIHPLAGFFTKKLHFGWRLAVNLLYFILLILILALLIWGGLNVLRQVQNLIHFLQTTINNLPSIFENLTTNPLLIGPYTLDLAHTDYSALWSSLSGSVNPLLAEVGTIVGSIASSTFSVIAWTLFSILVSYFITLETGGTRGALIQIDIPGYTQDIQQLRSQITMIWNAFLRGQMIIFLIVATSYTILLGSMGVNFFLGLALLAGIARFIPYLGAFVTWVTFGLVAFFQGVNPYNLTPFGFAILVVLIAWIIDAIIDNFITPRIIADALEVNPAAVMVAALIGVSFFGVIGVLLSAPVLASALLITNYAFYKVTDQDPWENILLRQKRQEIQWMHKPTRWLEHLVRKIFYRLRAGKYIGKKGDFGKK